MIDFCLKISKKITGLENYLKNCIEITKAKNIKFNKGSKVQLFFLDNTIYKKIDVEETQYIIIGDLIVAKGKTINDILKEKIEDNIKYFKGFFYIIEINKNNINIFSSVFNILPIFYYSDNKEIIISSKAFLIKESIDFNLELNKRFILEQRLFNYSFFNETIFNEIKLLPSNSYIEVKNLNLSIIKHTRIEEYFTFDPIPWKDSIDDIVDLFLDTVDEYLPDERFFLTFTGGFDGRTLVACAKKLNREFTTFSFGASDNPDLMIPMDQSKKLGIDFFPIPLEKEYIEKDFLEHGLELLKISDCNSSFLQIHFLYAAKKLNSKINFIVNGMFGSELMRAMHISGQVTSKALVDFFMFDSEDKWIKLIKESPNLNFLNRNNFKNEMDGLIDDLKVYKTNLNPSLSKNHIFYKFIFEEAFRKFFGVLIMAQFSYLNVRSPYLDFKFISEFLKTELAGANNDFFTHNPLKRKKGQLFYAKIMEKSCKQLLYLRNDKWYKPIDLIRSWGILNIALGYFGKRIKKKFSPPIVDNLRIVSGMNYNMDLYKALEINENLFNKSYINDLFENSKWLKNRDKFVEILSVIYYLNKYGIGKQK